MTSLFQHGCHENFILVIQFQWLHFMLDYGIKCTLLILYNHNNNIFMAAILKRPVITLIFYGNKTNVRITLLLWGRCASLFFIWWSGTPLKHKYDTKTHYCQKCVTHSITYISFVFTISVLDIIMYINFPYQIAQSHLILTATQNPLTLSPSLHNNMTLSQLTTISQFLNVPLLSFLKVDVPHLPVSLWGGGQEAVGRRRLHCTIVICP